MSRLSTLSRANLGSFVSIDTATSLISNESLFMISLLCNNNFHRIDSFTLYIFSNSSLRLELTVSACVSCSASLYPSLTLRFTNQKEINRQHQYFEEWVIRDGLLHVLEQTHNLLRLTQRSLQIVQQTQYAKINGVTGIHRKLALFDQFAFPASGAGKHATLQAVHHTRVDHILHDGILLCETPSMDGTQKHKRQIGGVVEEGTNRHVGIEWLRQEEEVEQFGEILGIADFLLNLCMRRRSGENNDGNLDRNGDIDSIRDTIVGQIGEKGEKRRRRKLRVKNGRRRHVRVEKHDFGERKGEEGETGFDYMRKNLQGRRRRSGYVDRVFDAHEERFVVLVKERNHDFF